MSHMASVRATIVDGDNTLWKGGAIAGIGASLILQELRRLHFSSVINVMAAERGISKVLRKYSGIEGKLMGQELLYQMLASSGIARRDDLSRFAANYIRNNAVGSVCNIVSAELYKGNPVFLVTASGTSAAMFARSGLFNIPLTDFRSNVELFNGPGVLIGFRSEITSGAEKLDAAEQMLNAYGLRIRDCQVIGDSELDLPLMKASLRPIASPFATERVRELCKIILPRK